MNLLIFRHKFVTLARFVSWIQSIDHLSLSLSLSLSLGRLDFQTSYSKSRALALALSNPGRYLKKAQGYETPND